MPSGTLEVFLENAKGLKDTDWLTRMDPYVVITCRTQEKKSDVASGAGSDPEWNETFVFTISRDAEEISVKIMDKDTFSSDDFVGEVTISLHEVFREGEVPKRSYNVVRNEKYCGEIKLGLSFTSETVSERGSDKEEYGAHRRSSDGYRRSDEEDHRGRRKSHYDNTGSYEEEHGGGRQSRHDYGRSDEYNYGGHRGSRNHHKGSDEHNYGGYRESRDDY